MTSLFTSIFSHLRCTQIHFSTSIFKSFCKHGERGEREPGARGGEQGKIDDSFGRLVS